MNNSNFNNIFFILYYRAWLTELRLIQIDIIYLICSELHIGTYVVGT